MNLLILLAVFVALLASVQLGLFAGAVNLGPGLALVAVVGLVGLECQAWLQRRAVSIGAAAAVLLLPALAFAESAASSPPFFTTDLFATFVGVACMVGVAIFRAWRKDSADRELQLFEKGVAIAYGVVSEIAVLTPTQLDDKAAAALKVLRDYLANHSIELTPEREAEARLRWQALHGAEKVQEKQLAEAAAAKALRGTSLATELAAIGKGG